MTVGLVPAVGDKGDPEVVREIRVAGELQPVLLWMGVPRSALEVDPAGAHRSSPPSSDTRARLRHAWASSVSRSYRARSSSRVALPYQSPARGRAHSSMSARRAQVAASASLIA